LNFADLLFGFSIFYAFVALFFKFKNRISYGLVNISIPHIQTDPYPASSKTPRAVKLLQEQTLNHWSSRVVFFTPRSDLFFLHKSHDWSWKTCKNKFFRYGVIHARQWVIHTRNWVIYIIFIKGSELFIKENVLFIYQEMSYSYTRNIKERSYSYTKKWVIHTRKWVIHMSYSYKGMSCSYKGMSYSEKNMSFSERSYSYTWGL
jgi:hypothetical protein